MPYSKSNVPSNHSEFSGGPGMIDPVVREDRTLETHQQLWELYATNPASPDESNPGVAEGYTDEDRAAGVPPTDAQFAAARLRVAGQNDPLTSEVERP